MDKKSIIALVLMGAILVGYSLYTAKQQEKRREAKARYAAQHPAEPPAQAAPAAPQQAQPAADTLARAAADPHTAAEEALRSNLGETLYAAREGEEQTLAVENDVLRIVFSSRGGKVEQVMLKDYTRYAPRGERNEPLQLIKPGSSRFDMILYVRNGVNNVRLNTAEYNFALSEPVQMEGYRQVTMTLPVNEEAAIEYVYRIYDAQSAARNYMVDFDVRLRGLGPYMSNQSSIAIDWGSVSLRNEKGFQNENMATTISYRYPGEKSIEELSAGESRSEKENHSVNWVAFKQQFFSSVLIAPANFQSATMGFTTFPEGSPELKDFSAKLTVPYTAQTEGYDFRFYFGPNKYSILNKVRNDAGESIALERLIPLGWGIFGWVNRWFVIPLFDFLNRYIDNFGWIILIMTILIKIIISPLTYKSYLSTAKMRVIKPEMDEIAAKYPKQEDAMKKQQATMELYKRAGINPMGGCLPLLIQMPILIAMFRFFPASIELRGESFLWADDLSSYDAILNLPFHIPWYGSHVSLFALLMAISMFVYSKFSYNQTASSQPQMAGMKFMMVYMMPVMMLLWFNNYASGLCYYYLLSNLITIGQTYGIRAMVDDEKVREQMKANASKVKKKKKKSRFQQRYEELLKQQEEMRRQQARRK